MGGLMIAEQIHRYPRWISWPIELLSTLGVIVTLAMFGRDLLRYLWFRNQGADTTFFQSIPFLPEFYLAVNGVRGTDRDLITQLTQLVPTLGWLALALLLALILRNALPTVRTSPRGMLIEFSGGWLPIPWESLQTIKVTEDLSAERFVLLAETGHGYLTGWHRFYSFFYRFGFRRGFLIISAINDFNGLIKTLLSESDRVARVLENVKPARLQEDASSPLFRFLLGPASFFSRRTKNEIAVPFAAVAAGGPVVRGAYPHRITRLLSWGAGLLTILMALRYIIYWLKFLRILFPGLVAQPIFNRLELLDLNLQAPWWLLVAAHLMLGLMLGLIFALRNLLPELETRNNGLALRYFKNWVVIPWPSITAIKVTEFSEESQIVLVQTSSSLPFAARLSSLIYDGSFTPGVLMTSALNTFEPLLQRVVLEISRYQGDQTSAADRPIFQNEARSSFLLLSFRAGTTIDQLVAELREDEESKTLQVGRLLRAARPMFWLALPPALLMLFDRAIQQGILPDLSLIVGVLVLFLLSLLEWPLVCLLSVILDEMSGGGEEDNRAFYLYPMTQLPRLLPLVGGLVMVLLGIPILPVLFWIGAIGWSFLLAAGLWEALYGWRSGQLLAGGLIPVVFQLLILLAYIIVLR
jgi:hypothetical protein